MWVSVAKVPTVESEPTQAGAACPGVENPHALMTSWDMQQFTSAKFFTIGHNLAEVQKQL
jgi:hypothetical protein